MICMENQYGTVRISQGYFASLVGRAASECFGVAGLLSSPGQGIRSALAGRDAPDKGVRVRGGEKGLYIDLHIAVVYGMNLTAITKSIVNRVRYTVERYTGLKVAQVNVCVNAMLQE